MGVYGYYLINYINDAVKWSWAAALIWININTQL